MNGKKSISGGNNPHDHSAFVLWKSTKFSIDLNNQLFSWIGEFNSPDHSAIVLWKRSKKAQAKPEWAAMFKSTKMRHRSDTMINYAMPTLTEKES